MESQSDVVAPFGRAVPTNTITKSLQARPYHGMADYHLDLSHLRSICDSWKSAEQPFSAVRSTDDNSILALHGDAELYCMDLALTTPHLV